MPGNGFTIQSVRSIATRLPHTTRVISELDALARWEGSWRELAEQRGNPFVTPEWYRSFIEVYGEEAEPFVIIAGTVEGDCYGVLPLVKTGNSVLRFAGADFGDHFHPACAEVCEREFASLTAGALRQRSDLWSTAVLHGTEVDSAWLAGLRAEASPLAVVAGPATPMPFVNLHELDWDTYWGSRSRKLKKYVRSRTNQLKKQHRVRFRCADDLDRLSDDMTTMFGLHERRFGESSLLLDPTAQRFHRRFAEAASRQGWLRLTFLEIDDQPVAASYGWSLGGRYGDYNGGFEPAWAKMSVGLLLMVHTLQTAFDEDAEEYDLLLGDEQYKSRFTSEQREAATVIIGPRFHPQRLVFSAQLKLHGLTSRLPGSARDQLRRSVHPLLRRLPTTRSV